MLISIITINYNDKEGLENTINSVKNQDFKDFEHIIIDGNSTDGSKAVIEQYKNNFSYSVSEPDSGIYNAMNKGIKQAKGKYLLFLNSGDSLYSSATLSAVKDVISNDFDIYYGNVLRIYENNIKKVKSYNNTLSFSFFVDSALAHQTVFIKRELFSKFFYYNEDYKILADWDFLIYAICKQNVSYKHLGIIVANYNMNGISSQPESKTIMETERKLTYQKYFPLFYEDYKELFESRKILGSQKIKRFLKLQDRMFTRKLSGLFIKILR